MVIPHLFPKGKNDKEAYWKTYDWGRAIAFGMKYAGLNYSREYNFAETSYVFPITHMVAPKDNVVECQECHIRKGSRMANITGLYIPGRDGSPVINFLGWALVIGSLAGVLLHALGRIFATAGKKEE